MEQLNRRDAEHQSLLETLKENNRRNDALRRKLNLLTWEHRRLQTQMQDSMQLEEKYEAAKRRAKDCGEKLSQMQTEMAHLRETAAALKAQKEAAEIKNGLQENMRLRHEIERLKTSRAEDWDQNESALRALRLELKDVKEQYEVACRNYVDLKNKYHDIVEQLECRKQDIMNNGNSAMHAPTLPKTEKDLQNDLARKVSDQNAAIALLNKKNRQLLTELDQKKSEVSRVRRVLQGEADRKGGEILKLHQQLKDKDAQYVRTIGDLEDRNRELEEEIERLSQKPFFMRWL